MGGESVCIKYADDWTIVVPVFKNNNPAAECANSF